MKKIFSLFLIFCVSIFSGCSLDDLKPNEIKKIEKHNKELAEEKENEKEYRKKIDEGFELLFREKNYEKARATFMSAMSVDIQKANNDAKLYYYLGLTEYYLKNYSSSFQCFDKSIQLDDKNGLTYEGRGDLNYDLENWTEAVNDYTQAIRWSSDIPFGIDATYERRGDCYYNLGKFTEAKWDYGTVVDRNKYNAEAFFKLGMCYDKLGDMDNALKNFEQAKKLGYLKK